MATADKVRLALCQVDTTIGAFEANASRILEFVKRAGQEKADIAILPELCVSSYPPLDLLDRPDFIDANMKAFEGLGERLCALSEVPECVILGSILRNPEPRGRAIQNAAVVFLRGKLVHVQPKRLLPTYDVFDEARYFEPGARSVPWESPWGRIGLSVCEDAWFEDTHLGRLIYEEDPAASLKGCDLAINISASPFERNKRARRNAQLKSFARRIGAPMAVVNQVGANDEILFDGGSLILDASGAVFHEMPSFREGISVVEVELRDFRPETEVRSPESEDRRDGSGGTKGIVRACVSEAVSPDFGLRTSVCGPRSVQWERMFPEKKSADDQSGISHLHRALVMGIRDYFRKTGFKKAVVGLSGGIDSSVVACLAAEALGPRNVLGVSMPSQFSSSSSLVDAEALAKAVGLEYRVHSLKFIFTTLLMELKPSLPREAGKSLPADATEENMQARLRAVMLMALANKRGALLLTTGNKSELAVGYCTTYGDMAGAINPIGDVYKTAVYELARHINSKQPWIPQSTLTKPPSAELRPNQTDQDTLPPYDVLDRLLEVHIEGSAGEAQLLEAGFRPELVREVLPLVRAAEFKRRQAAPVLKVTSKAFGLGRRFPVAKSF